MKRDMGLVRELLLAISRADDQWPECTPGVLEYHLLLLQDNWPQGRLARQRIGADSRSPESFEVLLGGDKFLSAIRDEKAWDAVLQARYALGHWPPSEVVEEIGRRATLSQEPLRSPPLPAT